MLKKIGVKESLELFSQIPEKSRIKKLNIPDGISEQALAAEFEQLASKNTSTGQNKSYLGAGIYEHFIPAVVPQLAGRSEFVTAYTPYQPEASQGTLQTIFEYQSMICGLTGLDVSNASLYDGASATAEAALMAIRTTGKTRICVSKGLHPEYAQVLSTYLQGTETEISDFELNAGSVDPASLKAKLNENTAAFIIQSPNFFGIIEDLSAVADAVKSSGALLIVVCNPISLGLLKSPGEAGADIAVGEGQVLGNRQGLGGFSFGFMACKKEFLWKMPGRIAGQTTDTKGRRGFVLTIQSREQHIRREKATSNICTNAALNALFACVYLSGWGPEGFRRLAEINIQNSRYAFENITKINGFTPVFPDKPFFNEFAIKTTKKIPEIRKKLASNGIIGPFELGDFHPEMKDCLLFCVTETKTKKDIDKLVEALKSV
ncbi:MAG: aminomethyl-transferring glycine dehydrogenase subunit GcvPA [Endomicrobiales bacterium]|nr:aminomethyl-transferring glycine dehydrogenase subunit GcvPA [Endomicrobiales bacterium]